MTPALLFAMLLSAAPADDAYDARVRSAMASAQALRGPLEGGWVLSAGGKDLYALELMDRNGTVDGAWRDLSRVAALNASGFIAPTERIEGRLSLTINAHRVGLMLTPNGTWIVEISGENATQRGIIRRSVVSENREK